MSERERGTYKWDEGREELVRVVTPALKAAPKEPTPLPPPTKEYVGLYL